MNTIKFLLRTTPLLVVAGSARAQIPVFSIDWRGATISTPDSFTGTPITEGDLLVPQPLTPMLGFLPTPGIIESGGSIFPVGLNLPLHAPCVGHAAGTPCAVEVDALSFGMAKMVDCSFSPILPPPRWVFSVHYRALGVPGTPPDVASESVCADEGADVFQALFVPCGPTPPGPVIGNTAIIDGNGLPNCAGTGSYPGLGLIENVVWPPRGDDLDALDMNVPDVYLPRTTCVFFSLDSAFFDPGTSTFNSGSAVANGFVGGDVLQSCPSCSPSVYASALQLGLDLFGPADSDDLDALVLRENGIAGYQRSTTPYDWLTGASDMLFFSVRRGSAICGKPDAFFGIPIEPGDILVPTGPLGSPPGIWCAAETLGLATSRSIVGYIGDDLDALDVLQDPAPGGGFCPGDGSGTACPCTNFGAPGRGCGSSVNALGALLWANGYSSISNDTVHFTASGLPSTTTVIMAQGTVGAGGGLGVPYGDGLRCVAGATKRYLKRTALCGNREFGYGVPGDPLISVVGGLSGPGTIYYQAFYRNIASFCTPSTFNTTNGYRIVWTP